MTCSCPPNVLIPSKLERAHYKRSDLTAEFLALLQTIRDERDPNDEGRFLNRLGRCPSQDCDLHLGPSLGATRSSTSPFHRS
jgi:hypothetical protein